MWVFVLSQEQSIQEQRRRLVCLFAYLESDCLVEAESIGECMAQIGNGEQQGVEA